MTYNQENNFLIIEFYSNYNYCGRQLTYENLIIGKLFWYDIT